MDDLKRLGMLKKMGNKTKIGEYDPVEVVEALQSLDPAWSIEDALTVVTLHTYGDLSDYASDTLLPALCDFEHGHVSKAFTKKENYTFSLGRDADAADLKVVEKNAKLLAPKLRVYKGKKFPTDNLVDGEILAASVFAHEYRGYGHEVFVALTGLGLTVPAWRITSPTGAELVLPVIPQCRRKPVVPGNSRAMTAATLWTWLYKKSGVEVATLARAQTETDGLVEKERIAKLKKVEPGTVGHCAVCDRLQKLSRTDAKTMVLHGYERPGYGYIIGNCLGYDFKPYEISPEGCEHAAKVYDDEAKALKKMQREVSDLPSLIVHRSVGPFRIKSDGSSAEMKRSDLSPLHRPVYLSGYGEFTWDEAVKAHQAEIQKGIDTFEGERDRMLAKVEAWTLQPLPGLV